MQQRPADHILLAGPPGLGKTTLAMIVAHESGRPLRLSSGPAIQHAGDLAALLSSLTPGRGAVHRRDPPHGALRRRDAVPRDGGLPHRHHGRQGRGSHQHPARSRAVHPRRRDDALRAAAQPAARPLRLHRRTSSSTTPTSSSRCSQRVRGACSSVDIAAAARAEIARRSRGTPRIANRLLRRVRDYVARARRGSAGDADAVRRRARALRRRRDRARPPRPRGARRARAPLRRRSGRTQHARRGGRRGVGDDRDRSSSRTSCGSASSGARPAVGSRRPAAYAHLGVPHAESALRFDDL